MATFSDFLTQHWAKERGKHLAMIVKRGKTPFLSHLPEHIDWQTYHHLVRQTLFLLSNQPLFSRSSVIAYSGSSRLLGLLCYCAIIAGGKKVLMLNPALPESRRQQLLAEYGIEFVITDHLFANFSENLPACPLVPQDHFAPATLTLTSGSSGMPKAVVHSVANHLANAAGVCEFMQFQQQHSWLLSLPLFHVSGQGIVWRWLLQGATLFIDEEKETFFDTLTQVSHASLVPTQLQRYLAQEHYFPTAVKQQILLGGAAIPAELVRQAQQKGITTYSGYGMTEMASTICAVCNETESVGLPLKGREVMLENKEIWVKGECLALGYWQKNQQIQPLVNHLGWLQTKDRGCWNEKGQLVVVGRMDNMFISGGENIQPEELEKILFQAGNVQQILVVPKKDAEFGERPVAFVAFSEPFNQQAVEKLRNFAKQHLEKFKQPIDYLPLEVEKYQQGGIKISRKELGAFLDNNAAFFER